MPTCCADSRNGPAMAACLDETSSVVSWVSVCEKNIVHFGVRRRFTQALKTGRGRGSEVAKNPLPIGKKNPIYTLVFLPQYNIKKILILILLNY
jgi:hypothetical protein